MNVDDILLYDLKYGDLHETLINDTFYPTEETYLDEDLNSIIERLIDLDYLESSQKIYPAKCKYCGYSKFMVVPEDVNNENSKEIYVCGGCGKTNDKIYDHLQYDGYVLSKKSNNAVELMHEFFLILNENKMNFNVSYLMKANFHTYIFSFIIKNDYDYLIDIYLNTGVKDVLEMVMPFKLSNPSKKIVAFNITDQTDEKSSNDMTYYSGNNIENLTLKFKEFINKINNNKMHLFGIGVFDDIMPPGLKKIMYMA